MRAKSRDPSTVHFYSTVRQYKSLEGALNKVRVIHPALIALIVLLLHRTETYRSTLIGKAMMMMIQRIALRLIAIA